MATFDLSQQAEKRYRNASGGVGPILGHVKFVNGYTKMNSVNFQPNIKDHTVKNGDINWS